MIGLLVKPYLNHDVLQLSIKVNKATVKTLTVNKSYRIKITNSYITFPKLNNTVKLLFTDASHANFPDESKVLEVIFLWQDWYLWSISMTFHQNKTSGKTYTSCISTCNFRGIRHRLMYPAIISWKNKLQIVLWKALYHLINFSV